MTEDNMQAQIEQENELLRQLVEEPGFAVLESRTQALIDQIRWNAINLEDEKQLYQAKGQVAGLMQLATLRASIFEAEQEDDAES